MCELYQLCFNCFELQAFSLAKHRTRTHTSTTNYFHHLKCSKNVAYFSLRVFLFEYTQLLKKRKIPEATQICQSLSQELSLKTKLV